MTINIADNSPRISYTVAQGATQTSFAVPFEFFDNGDLNVYIDGTLKTITTHYTVTGGDGSTGTVSMSVTGGTGGSIVVITRDIELERTTDFPVSGAFNIVALNTELDRLVAVAADLNDRAARSIQAQDFDTTVSYTLPVVNDRKGKVLGFNASTGAVEAGPQIADVQSLANISADIATLADIEDGTDATDAIQNVNTIRANVTTVAGIASNVTTVAGNNSNVTTVAGSISNVNTVASNISSVNTVATNISSVVAVANDLAEAVSEVETVANDLNEAVSEIDTVAGSITNVDSVGGSIANVNTVATNISNVNTVAGVSSNVTTVAGISSNVTTVAGIASNVTAVAGDATDIGTVASNISNVNTVAGISSNVTTVANDGTDIGTVAGISSNVTTVAGISSDVTTVAGQISPTNNIATVAGNNSNISTVAGNNSNISTVAGINSDVTTVAGISSNVTTVAGISANVTTVAGDTTNIGTIATNLGGTDTIGTVASNISNVNTVGGISANVTTVAGISSDVTAVANDATDIGTVATNISNINSVAGNSTNINSVASNSSNINAVAADATDIGTVATNISNVNSVGGSISNVNTVATNLATINDFADKYRIGSSDPSSNNDEGDLFYNTTSNTLKVYTGSAWEQGVTAGSGFLALTGGQLTGNVTFSGSQTVDGRDLSVDGAKLDGIEAGATADQTKSDIDALNINADTVDSLHASSFLRSDAADSASGTITVATGTDPAIIAKSDEWGEQLEILRNHASFWPSVKFSNTSGEKGKVFVDTSNNNLMYVKGSTSNYETVWTSLTDGSGSGLDADTLDGVQGSSYLRSDTNDTFTGDLDINGNINAVNSIYVADYVTHEGDTNTFIHFTTDEIRLTTGGSQEVTIDTTGVRLGDTGNGYFRPVSGNFGSIEIDGGSHGGYEGYNIGGRAAFLHNNGTETGISNDVDNHWMVRLVHGGAAELYHNGSKKLETTSTGANIDGDLNAVDNIYLATSLIHEGDTDTKLLFGDNIIYLQAGGVNSHILTQTYTSTYVPTYNYAAYFEEAASLSGTTPTINAAASGVFYLTMSGNTTFTFTNTSSNWGVGFTLYLTGNGGTVTWPASVDWAGGTAPDAPANGEVDVLVFHTRDGSNWVGALAVDAAA